MAYFRAFSSKTKTSFFLDPMVVQEIQPKLRWQGNAGFYNRMLIVSLNDGEKEKSLLAGSKIHFQRVNLETKLKNSSKKVRNCKLHCKTWSNSNVVIKSLFYLSKNMIGLAHLLTNWTCLLQNIEYDRRR